MDYELAWKFLKDALEMRRERACAQGNAEMEWAFEGVEEDIETIEEQLSTES